MINRGEIIMKLYVAYGSNLDKEQMKYRCPSARPVQSGYLDNWQLIYRGSKTGAYASIHYKKGCRVPVGLWEITKHDERFLDRYEGYPIFYQKKNIFVHLGGGSKVKAMVYIMRSDASPGAPSKQYLRTILRGYADFGLDESYLIRSILQNQQETGKERE